jgi:hypothetical protein
MSVDYTLRWLSIALIVAKQNRTRKEEVVNRVDTKVREISYGEIRIQLTEK